MFWAGIRSHFNPFSVDTKGISNNETPVLLVHSVADDYTNYKHSERIESSMDKRFVELWKTDWGAGHNLSLDTNYSAYKNRFYSFLKKHKKLSIKNNTNLFSEKTDSEPY